jgi:hypothetical protein
VASDNRDPAAKVPPNVNDRNTCKSVNAYLETLLNCGRTDIRHSRELPGFCPSLRVDEPWVEDRATRERDPSANQVPRPGGRQDAALLHPGIGQSAINSLVVLLPFNRHPPIAFPKPVRPPSRGSDFLSLLRFRSNLWLHDPRE